MLVRRRRWMVIHSRFQMMFAFNTAAVCLRKNGINEYCSAVYEPSIVRTESNLSDCLQNYYLLLFNQVFYAVQFIFVQTWASRDKFILTIYLLLLLFIKSMLENMNYWQVSYTTEPHSSLNPFTYSFCFWCTFFATNVREYLKMSITSPVGGYWHGIFSKTR